MPVDLAIDLNSGDLLIAPNNDAEIRSGQDLVNQRIRVRLKIWRGQWTLDPTNGTLGSGLRDALRLPMNMALQAIPLLVREALTPMEDILVTDVEATPSQPQVATEFVGEDLFPTPGIYPDPELLPTIGFEQMTTQRFPTSIDVLITYQNVNAPEQFQAALTIAG